MLPAADIRQAFSARLKQACTAAGIGGHGAGAHLARALGVTPKAVSKWFNAEAMPSPGKMHSLAALLHVTPQWLQWGNSATQERSQNPVSLISSHADLIAIRPWDDATPLDADEVETPYWQEVQLSAGSGRSAAEHSPQDTLRFSKMSLRKHGVQFDQAICLAVHGNSMQPVLPDGSTVAVNLGATQITDGKIYALEHDGQLRVKVLYRLPDGGIRLTSYNQAEHPDEQYSAQHIEQQRIVIIGQVFWSAVFH